MHMLGAWAIALRVFHPAVLRNTGGGGKEGARRVRAALRLWHEGRYDICYDRPLRERVLQKASKVSSERKVNKQIQRAIYYMRQGRVSRAVQALEAADVMPGTEVTLAELRKLCPPAFVPQDCLRRAAISGGSSNAVTIAAEDVEARRRDSGG